MSCWGKISGKDPFRSTRFKPSNIHKFFFFDIHKLFVFFFKEAQVGHLSDNSERSYE